MGFNTLYLALAAFAASGVCFMLKMKPAAMVFLVSGLAFSAAAIVPAILKTAAS
jgi:4-amino-4-deoxy-L-arabinose transferase-like glycosyltransferase